MSAETALRTLLLADGPTAALVATRVTADRVEQTAARPFIVFTRTGTERSKGLDGTVLGVRATLQVETWADTRVSAEAVADAMEAAIEGAHQFVVNRGAGFDPDLDLESTVLTVDWWD